MPKRVSKLVSVACFLLVAISGFAAADLASARRVGPPAVSVPSVSVPTVSTPTVTVPTVTVPPVTVPGVSQPQPKLPPVTVPSGTSSGGSHQSGNSGSGAGAAAGAAASNAASGAQSAVGALLGQSSGAGVSSSSARSGQATTSPAARRAGSDHHGGFTKRYLHRLISRYQGCLSVVSSRYATVLTLRTGWGIGRSYSRRAVARRLHISLAREGQIERRAVSALGTAQRRGSCARAQRANRAALFLTPSEQSLLAQPFLFLGTSHRGTSHQAAKGHRSRPARHHQSVSGASTGGVSGSIPSLPRPGAGSTFPWLFIALGLVLATALASPLVRRRMVRTRSAGGHAGNGRVATPGGAIARAESEAPALAAAGVAAAGAAGLAKRSPERPAREDPSAASSLGARLERQGDIEGALAAYRRADAGGHAAGATNLGALLEQRGDTDGAIAAYRRADQRGDANGSFNLGCLLAEQGDVAGAIEALRRADERGDAAGASNLGVLLEQQGDLEAAVDAYRRADRRGDANGSFNLGLLLAGRGDIDEAQAAYTRAAERGDREVVDRARSALAELRSNGAG